MTKLLYVPAGIIFDTVYINGCIECIFNPEYKLNQYNDEESKCIRYIIDFLEEIKIIPIKPAYNFNLDDIRNLLCIEEFEVLDE